MELEKNIHPNCRCTPGVKRDISLINRFYATQNLKAELKAALKIEDYEQCTQIKIKLENIKIEQIKDKYR